MKNYLFTKQHIEVLLNPADWRLIASGVSSEVDSVHDGFLEKWCLDNSEKHSHYEIMIALKGETNYSIKNKIYPVLPGTVIFFIPGEIHQKEYPVNISDVDHLWIRVLKSVFTAHLVQSRNGKQKIRHITQPVMTLDEAGISFPGESFAITAAGGLPENFGRMRFIAALSVLISSLVADGYTRREKIDKIFFQREIIETIKSHIRFSNGSDNLEHLAQIAGYSKFHFLRMFKKITGYSVKEYINICRLKTVEKMLNSGVSKKAISIELGFSSPAAFSRWHKSRTLHQVENR